MTAAPGGPVFVVGAMGSGTTLMRLILDSHPNLAIAQETGFARLLLANEHVPFWKFGGEWYGRIGLSRDDLDAELRSFYGRLFAQFAAQRGATRWGEKTPFHTWHVARLARVFPDCVFVGTVRHPGAVASSLHERFGYPWEQGVRHWMRSTTELVHRGSRLADRVALCRYEDLVTEPQPVLRELVAWLGEPWSEQVLSFHEVHRRRGTAGEVEGRTRSDQPLDPARVARWTGTVDGDGRRLLRRTAALARVLGYDLDEPLPVAPISDVRIATGADLTALVAPESGVDWRAGPRPTLENRPMRSDDIKRLRRLAAVGAGRVPPARSRPSWSRRAKDRVPPGVRRRLAALRRRPR